MTRVISIVLVLAGAFCVWLGVRTFYSAYEGEKQAQTEWQTQEERPPAPIQPSAPIQSGDTIAKLSIARLNSEWYVIAGAGKSELRRGPGHVSESALPGENGNCIIAGHRDTHFRELRNVQVGEEITLDSGGKSYLYRVTERRVIKPTETSVLNPTKEPILTLITCYPFYYVGPAPNRFIVRAELIEQQRASRAAFGAF